MKSSLERRIAFISLIALAWVVFLGKAYENTLRGIDSNIHAQVSMNVTSDLKPSNHGVSHGGGSRPTTSRFGFLPKLPIPDPNSSLSEPSSYFNDHPFFYFWMNGKIMRLLGPSGWSARILTASFSVGCVLLTVWLGTTLHSVLFGFISGAFLLFTRDIILTGATVSLDPALMFFILLSYVFWLKQKWIGVGIVTGIGLWIKTPVVLLVYPVALVVSLLQGKSHKQFYEEFPKIARSAALALGIGSFVWIITGVLGGWNLVQDYWIRQVWGTAVGGRHQAQGSNPWMVFHLIRNGFIPGLPFLILALIQIIRKRLWQHPAFVVSGASIAVLALAITPVKFRMDYYFNPVFPFLALISSFSIVSLIEPLERNFYAAFSSLVPPLLAYLLCTPTPLGPEAFVALKRFIPFIQSYGNCDDEVMIVAGGEPVGSSHDYGLVVNFYTGHTVDIQSCTTVGTAIRQNNPPWILISQENLNQCLSAAEKALYPDQLKVGSQYLLSKILPDTDALDLSPLERELKPSVDCKPQDYPNDIYHKGF